MTISELVEGIPDFDTWTHADRIRLLAWFIHRYENSARFHVGDVRQHYDMLSMAPPANWTRTFESLRQSKTLLKDTGGHYLERRVRDECDRKYGQRPATVAVQELLAQLPTRVPNVVERVFLEEALKCFAVGAYRAAVVMAWNLAYDHLCTYILAHHRSAFNVQWPVVFAKHYKDARISEVAGLDDFAELKESQVIKICRSAAIISGDVETVLSQKLGRRNSAAHPSGVAIEQLQAEEFIDDLVKNVVLKLTV